MPERWLWLGGSFLISVVWSNLAWFFRKPRPGSVGAIIARLSEWRFSPWVYQFLRLLYYVGVPAAALFLGRDALIARYLGILANGRGGDVWSNWAYDVGWAAALGFGAWVLLALGWWTYRRALKKETGAVIGAGASAWAILAESIYRECHWAFYRNAPIVALGPDVYWGTWLGLALVALEAFLNPAWRRRLADPQRAPVQLMQVALAVASSVLFLKTINLWLALVLHFGVSWGIASLASAFPMPEEATSTRQSPRYDGS